MFYLANRTSSLAPKELPRYLRKGLGGAFPTQLRGPARLMPDPEAPSGAKLARPRCLSDAFRA